MAMTRDKALSFMGLKEGASPAEVKKRYYKLAVQLHPDKKGGSEEQFQDLGNAYDELQLKNSPPTFTQANQTAYQSPVDHDSESMMQKSVETTFKARSAFKSSRSIIDIAVRTLELYNHEHVSAIKKLLEEADHTYMEGGKNARIDASNMLSQAAEELAKLSVDPNATEAATIATLIETATTASQAAVKAAAAENRAVKAVVLEGTYAFYVAEDALLEATDCADIAAEAKKTAISVAPEAANPKPIDPFVAMKARHMAARQKQPTSTSKPLGNQDTPSNAPAADTGESTMFKSLRSAYKAVRSVMGPNDNADDDKKRQEGPSKR